MRACSTVVFQPCPLPWTSSSSTAPGLNQNADALLKALDGEHESRLLKKSLRLRNEECKRDFLRLDAAHVAALLKEYPSMTIREADAFYKLVCFEPAFREKMASSLHQAGLPE